MILGVDPGIRNIGLAVVNEAGRLVCRETVTNPRKRPFLKCLAEVVRKVRLHAGVTCDTVVVEEVIWRGRRGMLPLAHVAGAVVGVAVERGCTTYLVTPAMKKNGRKPKAWSEHEWDAYLLARRALRPDETMRRRCSK